MLVAQRHRVDRSIVIKSMRSDASLPYPMDLTLNLGIGSIEAIIRMHYGAREDMLADRRTRWAMGLSRAYLHDSPVSD